MEVDLRVAFFDEDCKNVTPGPYLLQTFKDVNNQDGPPVGWVLSLSDLPPDAEYITWRIKDCIPTGETGISRDNPDFGGIDG